MIQAIVVVLIVAALSIIWSEIKQHRQPDTKTKGDVIDISDAWIDSSSLPYRYKAHLLNNDTLELYHRLLHALKGSEYVICPRVRLAEILDLPMRVENRQEYLNRISIRTVDLLICGLPGLKPRAVLTLQDKSSGRRDQLSDRFTANALKAAGLPHLSYDRGQLPDQQQLLVDLAEAGLKVSGHHRLSE